MSLFRAATILRAANLLAVIAWVFLLKRGGLLISTEFPLAALSAAVWVSAVAAFLLSEPPPAAIAAFLSLDALAVGLASLHAQPASADLLPGFFVPLTLAALLLPGLLAALVWSAAAVCTAFLLLRAGLSWTEPLFVVRLSALALAPAACAVVSSLLLARRARTVRESVSLQRQLQVTEYVTHIFFQLRDYLTSITTVTEHIALSAQDQAAKDIAQKLRRMVAELNAKIVRTVDAVQTTTRRTAPMAVDFDLGTVLAEAAESARASVPRPRVGLKLVCAPLAVQGNRRLAFCVLASILDNAFEAFPSDGAGTVRVELKPGEPCAEVLVEDDAGGVAPDRVARVFEPLSTSKSDRGGLGLGLSMARRMVEGTGGTVLLESAGGKTLVRIQFPVRPALPNVRTGDSTWASRRAGG